MIGVVVIVIVVIIALLLWWWFSRRSTGPAAMYQPPRPQEKAELPDSPAKPAPAVPMAAPPTAAAPAPLKVKLAPAPVVETVAPAPAPAPKPPAAAPKPDDLTAIEGIGPKISGMLRAEGITTYAHLAATDVSRLREIMLAANLRIADPTTWPEQAALAAAGKWDELKTLQGTLKAGRRA